jgi:diguanylate cyclase (GGDEF)-like protein
MANATLGDTASRDEVVRAIDAAVAVGTATLVQVDIDRFLEFTETAGGESGDALLTEVGSHLRELSQAEGWTFFRIGGDEFCLLAPGVGLEQAFLRAERLRLEVDETLAGRATGEAVCTASIGVANAPRDAKSAEELLRKAELALYAAKDQGGDAVALTPGEEMVMKSSYYEASQLARLKGLAERLEKKEAPLLREALDDLLRKYERT